MSTHPDLHGAMPIPVTLFGRGEHSGYYSMEKVFEAVTGALPSHIDARVAAAPVHAEGLWRRLLCISYARMRSNTVNHITGDISFVALALPGKRTIVTVHDFDRLYRLRGVRAAIFRYFYFSAPLHRCRYITTISAQVAKELKALFPDIASKVVIIPDCLPSGYQRSSKVFDAECPLVLQIGARPNKNIEALIRALEGQTYELHIVGQLCDDQKVLLERCRIAYRNSIDLSEAELLKAYAQADIVSFVSTYEGFGLPILEANAIGRPVITSNIPPMSDVAGTAACLVDPHSVRSIREGLSRLRSDATYREELVERGFENIKRYSAEEVAQQYARLYRRVARECNPGHAQPAGAVETL